MVSPMRRYLRRPLSGWQVQARSVSAALFGDIAASMSAMASSGVKYAVDAEPDDDADSWAPPTGIATAPVMPPAFLERLRTEPVLSSPAQSEVSPGPGRGGAGKGRAAARGGFKGPAEAAIQGLSDDDLQRTLSADLSTWFAVARFLEVPISMGASHLTSETTAEQCLHLLTAIALRLYEEDALQYVRGRRLGVPGGAVVDVAGVVYPLSRSRMVTGAAGELFLNAPTRLASVEDMEGLVRFIHSRKFSAATTRRACAASLLPMPAVQSHFAAMNAAMADAAAREQTPPARATLEAMIRHHQRSASEAAIADFPIPFDVFCALQFGVIRRLKWFFATRPAGAAPLDIECLARTVFAMSELGWLGADTALERSLIAELGATAGALTANMRVYCEAASRAIEAAESLPQSTPRPALPPLPAVPFPALSNATLLLQGHARTLRAATTCGVPLGDGLESSAAFETAAALFAALDQCRTTLLQLHQRWKALQEASGILKSAVAAALSDDQRPPESSSCIGELAPPPPEIHSLDMLFVTSSLISTPFHHSGLLAALAPYWQRAVDHAAGCVGPQGLDAAGRGNVSLVRNICVLLGNRASAVYFPGVSVAVLEFMRRLATQSREVAFTSPTTALRMGTPLYKLSEAHASHQVDCDDGGEALPVAATFLEAASTAAVRALATVTICHLHWHAMAMCVSPLHDGAGQGAPLWASSAAFWHIVTAPEYAAHAFAFAVRGRMRRFEVHASFFAALLLAMAHITPGAVEASIVDAASTGGRDGRLPAHTQRLMRACVAGAQRSTRSFRIRRSRAACGEVPAVDDDADGGAAGEDAAGDEWLLDAPETTEQAAAADAAAPVEGESMETFAERAGAGREQMMRLVGTSALRWNPNTELLSIDVHRAETLLATTSSSAPTMAERVLMARLQRTCRGVLAQSSATAPDVPASGGRADALWADQLPSEPLSMADGRRAVQIIESRFNRALHRMRDALAVSNRAAR